MSEFKLNPLYWSKVYYGPNNGAQNIQKVQNKMEREQSGLQEQNIRIKPEGEGWFSSAPAPESLLHQTFAQTEVLPQRPITLQVPPERTVLLSVSLQCKFYVGFSEFGIGVRRSGVGWETSRFICSDICNKDIHFRPTTVETFSSAV